MRKAFVTAAGIFGAAFCWLMSFKVLALWVGPEGVGLFAQLRQIIQTATIGATFGGTNLVVQGLAARDNKAARLVFRQEAFRLTCVAGITLGALMVLLAPQIALLTLSTNDPELVLIIRWLALAVIINVAATYLMAVLNGYRAFGYLALAQVLSPLVMTLILFAGWLGGKVSASSIVTIGFLAGFGVSMLVGFLGVERLSRDNHQIAANVDQHEIRKERRELLHFAISSLVAALSSVVTLLIIRAWIIEAQGLIFVGLFEVGWTLTFNYMTLFLTACNIIYLPTLSAAKDPAAQRACILKMAYLVLSGSLIVGCGLTIWPLSVISLLYSPDFFAAREVLVVLVVAIIVRGVSWVYGTLMVATRSSRAIVLSELMLNLLLLMGTKLVLHNRGSLADLGWAIVLPHLFYLVFVIEFVRNRNPLLRRRYVWPLVFLGIAPLIWSILVAGTSARSLLWPSMLAIMLTTMGCVLVYRRLAL